MVDKDVRETINKIFSRDKDGIMYTVRRIINIIEDSGLEVETIESMELILENISNLPLLLGLNNEYSDLLSDEKFVKTVMEVLNAIKTFVYLKDSKIYLGVV